MAYDLPTVDEFQTAFPEFADTEDARVQQFIDMAARQVDETWIETDYTDAIMFLAAHLLTVFTATFDTAGQDKLKSITIGQLSLTYADGAAIDKLTSTAYGAMYFALRQKNFPGFLVVN